MASLQEIKSRSASVSTTKKITKAMQLVATAKLKKAKRDFDGIKEYYQAVEDMFADLLSNIKDFSKIIPESKSDSTLWVVITSDIGLCGSYNSAILRLAKANIKSNDKVIMVGQKGVANFRVRGKTMFKEYPHVGDEPNYAVASGIGEVAISEYVTGSFKAIKVLHTKFINSVTFEESITQLLPIELKENKEQKQAAITEFEPDPKTVIENSLPLYTSSVIFGLMVESKVSEMTSRRTAMENATDNANELIEKLDLEYNRARQASITQEITEIVAGSGSE